MKNRPSYLSREVCLIGFTQRRDIEFFHGQTCLYDLFNLLLRTYSHHLFHLPRHNLPGDTVPISEPAALFRFRDSRQFDPVVVNLGLRLTKRNQRLHLVERELMIFRAVHGDELASGQDEAGVIELPFQLRAVCPPVTNHMVFQHVRIRENRNPVIHRRFSMTKDVPDEQKAWGHRLDVHPAAMHDLPGYPVLVFQLAIARAEIIRVKRHEHLCPLTQFAPKRIHFFRRRERDHVRDVGIAVLQRTRPKQLQELSRQRDGHNRRLT